jgi:hypothetical protein
MKKGFAGHPMKHAAPQLFTGASAPKKKAFAGPVQSRRIRQTFCEIRRGKVHPCTLFRK